MKDWHHHQGAWRRPSDHYNLKYLYTILSSSLSFEILLIFYWLSLKICIYWFLKFWLIGMLKILILVIWGEIYTSFFLRSFFSSCRFSFEPLCGLRTNLRPEFQCLEDQNQPEIQITLRSICSLIIMLTVTINFSNKKWKRCPCTDCLDWVDIIAAARGKNNLKRRRSILSI